MRIHLLSDLHLELSATRRAAFQPEVLDADVTVLAGDIDKGPRVLEWARATFPGHVLVVAGNHEFYGGHLQRTIQKMRAASCERVRFLERDEVVIDGVRFLGGTCWTDFSSTGKQGLARSIATQSMTDYRRIRAGSNFRHLTTEDVLQENGAFRIWLEGKLAEPFAGKTVVVTHHAPLLEYAYGPSFEFIGERHPLDAAYANDWDHLVRPPVVAWLYGHTHVAVDQVVHGVRLVCNPLGYSMGEETGFDPLAVFDIG